MKSWNTTICGLLGIFGTLLAQFWPEHTKLGLFIAQFAASAGLLFARDNKKSDEQVGAGVTQNGDGKKLLGVLLAGGILAGASGCMNTNPRAVAYRSLEAVKIVVEKAENYYGDQVHAGKVSAENQAKIDEQIIKFHAAFGVAVAAARADYTVAAARADYTAPASPDLDRLADSLVKLIYTFAKEPAP